LTLIGRVGALAVLAMLLNGCPSVPETDTQPTPPAPAPPVATAPQTVPPRAPAPTASYRTVDEYKRAIAQRVLDANAGGTFTGDLPPLLRAVVVMQLNIDANGGIRSLRTLRTPEREAETLATASIRRAGALPPPPPAMLRGGAMELTETWLFRDDGRFQIRSLAGKQLGE
jgi:protein TonB